MQLQYQDRSVQDQERTKWDSAARHKRCDCDSCNVWEPESITAQRALWASDLREAAANSCFTGSGGQPEHNQKQLQALLQHVWAVQQAAADA